MRKEHEVVVLRVSKLASHVLQLEGSTTRCDRLSKWFTRSEVTEKEVISMVHEYVHCLHIHVSIASIREGVQVLQRIRNPPIFKCNPVQTVEGC